MTETEKAYLAGLFDGEGCVGYYRRYTKGIPYHSASLHLASTDPRVMTWIMEVVGFGKVSLTHPKDRRTAFSWQVCNKPQVKAVLEAIRPYLVIKADQVDLLFSLWEKEELLPRGLTRELIELREQITNQIKQLKWAVHEPLEGVET